MVKRWPVWGIAVLSLVVLIAGLIATGGPAQGRAEKRDETRARDLSLLQQHLVCKSIEAKAAVIDPAPTGACPTDPRLTDPFTGAPYLIAQIDANNLRLCAAFELSVDPDRNYTNRDAAGCIVTRVNLE